MSIIMVTGHRPNKLSGYAPNPTQSWVREKLVYVLSSVAPGIAISGMALGVDTWWAEEALKLGWAVHAYIPFRGQECKWPMSSKLAYIALLNKATKVVVCSPGEYSAAKMQIRNERMVDAAEFCVAVWDGTPGGTANCVKYIQAKQKKLYVIDPKKKACYNYRY